MRVCQIGTSFFPAHVWQVVEALPVDGVYALAADTEQAGGG